jgi:photosystem II stability/assembly factor-like uncharacterized protein
MSLISAVAKRTKSLIVIVSMILLLPGLISWSGSERFSSDSNALAAPQRVLFSTYLGGQDTQTSGIALDRSGYIYVTGITGSPVFPLTTILSSQVTALPGAFVTKINPASRSIVYSIMIPGTAGASVAGIAVGDDGAAYITGTTFSKDFPATGGVFQPVFAPNATQSVFVINVDPSGSSVSYATLLGGSGIQAATSIAVDGSGAAYVTGTTNSTDFPVTAGAFQTSSGSGFISKISADGSSLVYSTLFGGSAPDSPTSIAVDESGCAYITGSAHSSDFPTTSGAFLPTKVSPFGADNPFVIKLNPAGSALVYSTYLGGSDGSHNRGNDIALSSDGSAVVVGSTNSRDFTAVNALFSCPRGGELLRTVDNGSTFSRIENGLPPTGLAAIAFDPGKRSAAYAAFGGDSAGLFKTWNSGKTWAHIGDFGPDTTCSLLAVDPAQTSTLYAAVSKSGVAGPASAVLKSIDGGKTWSDTGLTQQGLVVGALLVDSSQPSRVYAGFGGGSPALPAGAYRSLDGGMTWSLMTGGLPQGDVLALVQDPVQPSVVYAGGSKGLFQSRDGGSQWTTLIDAPIAAIAIDPTQPSVIYAGVLPNASASSIEGRGNPRKRVGQSGSATGLIKSVDGGANWRLINKGLRFADIIPNHILVDVNDSSTIYLACSDGLFVSANSGRRWAATDLSGYSLRALAQAPEGTIYAQGGVFDDAFVTKLGPSGGVLFSTYFGGFGEDQGLGVALDGSGNVYLAGTTRSTNLAVTGKAQQPQLAGGTDVFVAEISSSGRRILYSSYFGGSGEDLLSPTSTGGIAVDSARNIYLAGTTQSTDLPTLNALQPALSGNPDVENPPRNGFIAKLAAVGKGQ